MFFGGIFFLNEVDFLVDKLKISFLVILFFSMITF